MLWLNSRSLLHTISDNCNPSIIITFGLKLTHCIYPYNSCTPSLQFILGVWILHKLLYYVFHWTFSSFLKYSPVFWNILQFSGIFSKFLEYSPDFWNNLQISGIISSFLSPLNSFLMIWYYSQLQNMFAVREHALGVSTNSINLKRSAK